MRFWRTLSIPLFICCSIQSGAQFDYDSVWFDNYFTRQLDRKENNDPHAFDSLEIVHQLALQKNFIPAISRYHLEKAGLFISIDQKDSALAQLKEAVRYAESKDLPREKANAYLNLAKPSKP